MASPELTSLRSPRVTAARRLAKRSFRGKERMRRLMEMVRHGRVDLTPLLTHTFSLDNIGAAYDLFGERLDGVMKVAIRP